MDKLVIMNRKSKPYFIDKEGVMRRKRDGRVYLPRNAADVVLQDLAEQTIPPIDIGKPVRVIR